jgi:t-SNARE complex subunit (syntaxin)
MSQLNEHSKDQAQMAFKQGEMVNSIEAHITDTKANMDNAVIDIKEANEINRSTGGMLNKVVYVVAVIVVLLILLSWMMPK